MPSLRQVIAMLLGIAVATTGFALSVIPPEFPELVNGSDYIVRAKIKSVSYSARLRGERELIFTDIELEVLEVIVGTPPTPLVLTMLGGKMGDLELSVEGAPRFSVGDEDILFVSGNGRNFHPLYGVMHGRYPVRRDKSTGREHMTRNNGEILTDVAEVVLPMGEDKRVELERRGRRVEDALTPAEFISLIRATRIAKVGQRAK